MKRLVHSCILLMLIVFVTISCAPEATPTPTATKPPEKSPVAQKPAKPAWEEEWDKTVAVAKSEGKLVIYTLAAPYVMDAVRKPLKEKFGIDIEYITAMGPELTKKIFSERGAGLYVVDLFLGGPTTPTIVLKPAGVFASIKPLLLLPEVLDSNAYFDNEIPFIDKEEMYIISPQQAVGNTLAINSDLIKPGEIKGYADLLDPKWKEKISLYDPTMAGSGLDWFFVAATMMGPDFHRQLVKQNPMLTRDRRLQAEWVAKGKYHVALAPGKEAVTEFVKVGAPIKWVTPAEGMAITGTSTAALSYLDRAPHPNAAKVFVNWLMSKEGLTTLSQANLIATTRKDVPTDFLPPEDIRYPNVRYLNTVKEECQVIKDEMASTIAKEIYGPLLK